MKKKIGILDIQGSVEEHFECLLGLGVELELVKKPEQLDECDGLIIPGGESTTVGKLIKKWKLEGAIKSRVKKGMAVWGTCAGAILLAEDLGLIDAKVDRNAYGRQLDSFEAEVDFNPPEVGYGGTAVPGVFIRAPKITFTGGAVETLAKYKGDVVAAKEGNIMITTFHPELTHDLTVHRYFLEMC
jgi:pyridoxal 5'-phosphate synthase pdxT subunit